MFEIFVEFLNSYFFLINEMLEGLSKLKITPPEVEHYSYYEKNPSNHYNSLPLGSRRNGSNALQIG